MLKEKKRQEKLLQKKAEKLAAEQLTAEREKELLNKCKVKNMFFVFLISLSLGIVHNFMHNMKLVFKQLAFAFFQYQQMNKSLNDFYTT